jgi:hypothetical protein
LTVLIGTDKRFARRGYLSSPISRLHSSASGEKKWGATFGPIEPEFEQPKK